MSLLKKKINFNNKKSDFFILSLFCKKNNFNHSYVLNQALEQNTINDENQNLLFNFINSFKNLEEIRSQLYQDVFASFIINNKFEKTFLEFGATNGVDLSNSIILEKHFDWKGMLAEPSPQWHQELKKNRPNTKIITDCIWSKSNEELNFFVSDVGVLSTIETFKESDKLSMPGNTDERIKNGKVIKVKTISLNNVIKYHFNSKSPSYISIDTEGSEYEILKNFDFKFFRPLVLTIEHNFTSIEKKIDELMIKNEYVRVFKKLTSFDGWYVAREVFNKIN